MGTTTHDDELKLKALERIEAMEAERYEFPEPFSRRNWVAASVVTVAMALLLVAGVWM